MAGISEKKAESAHRQGVGYAKHLGVSRGSERWNAIVYGTKRAKGWKPSREVDSDKKRRRWMREHAGNYRAA